MTHTPHELAEDFPADAGLIRKLKESDAHFARLAETYHDVNREIHRLETRVVAASDVREEDLRKQRARIKDEIAGILSKAR